jgi:hypothetical protein
LLHATENDDVDGFRKRITNTIRIIDVKDKARKLVWKTINDLTSLLFLIREKRQQQQQQQPYIRSKQQNRNKREKGKNVWLIGDSSLLAVKRYAILGSAG